MTTTSFLTIKIRGRRDAVRARMRGRRIASLLGFDAHEQACIAAGTFVIACQALTIFGNAKLCFQIENHQLQAFAEGAGDTSARPTREQHRLSGVIPEVEAKSMFRLAKALPADQCAADELDLGWLVRKVEETASSGLFAEIYKQNQEVLALLHEVRLFQANASEKVEKTRSPHAA